MLKRNASAANTLQSITICYGLYTYFESKYYNDKGYLFGFSFEEFSNPRIKEINHHVLIKKCKPNLETAEY